MTDFESRRRMMVDTQIRPSDVTKFPIIEAMLRIPRQDFVPDAQREIAYADGLVPLGGGRYVLDPRTLAKILDVLDVSLNELVLDIGSGLGYSSAVIARMAQAVVALEADETMSNDAQQALAEISADNVIVETGALAEGAPEHGPYDVIIVEGGVAALPQALLDQLKPGGRIACVMMQGALGEVRVGYKLDGGMSWRFAFNAAAPVLPGFEKQQVFAL